MPACIAGMHRSGTSMVAKLLHASGLYLGPELDLLPPSPANPDGHWENRRFAKLNRRILKRLGGGWDDPPPSPAGWAVRPLVPLRAEAEAILADFADREPWGWKDPRNCLTLPFWQAILGAVPVVIVVRNPLEVAESLRQRNGFPLARGVALWHEYNRRLLDAVAPSDRIVTHYGAHFQNPELESRRLLTFLGLPVDEGTIGTASGARAADLRHHRLTTRDLLAAGVAAPVLELYRELCREADWSEGDPGRSDPGRAGLAWTDDASRRPAGGPT